MADGTVDNLNIQLSADANKAAQALNSMVNSLKSINDAFTKDIAGMRKFSKEIGVMTSALRSFSEVKINIPDFSKVSKAFKGTGDTAGAQNLSNEIEKVVTSFEKLSGLDFNDSGINKTVNALNRLFKSDFESFNPDSFRRITDAISSLGNMPDVSSSVNRFVSSLARLANAGEKTGQSANDILRLGEQTRLAAQQLSSIGAINDDINVFVQSIAKLSSAGAKTGQTASGLKSLADETVKFFDAMSRAPKISENTIRMTQALAQLASAGGRVSTSTSAVTSAFSRLSSIGSNTASALKKAASTIVSAFTQIGNSGKRVDSARLSLGNLLKTAVGFQIGYGLINFGKQAFELGSAITEVENVVNVAFGDMSQQAYDFASTATEQFGLSELAAKQYAGTMMAMLNSTGVAQDAAAEMSTTLAGLAGDLASFYNIDTDEAFRKLRSAMAGETEPMRELGVNMTVTALESYALSQGITESWQSMPQAEQAMLRYNYIMSATSQQQGDFQRTVGSFANQWRLLTLNVQQFSATIGQGLIAAVLPAIQAINALFSVLQRAATAFRNFMYVLTGYEGESSGGFVTDTATGLEGIGSAGTDAAGGLGDAADAAEDLKEKLTVLPFDELNQLSDNLSDTGNSGGGGGTGGLGDVGGLTDLGNIKDAFENSDLPEYVNEWAERIRDAFLDHDWDRLGKEIASGLNKGLKKIYDVINWKKVGPKITKFVDAFTDTLNSLVDNIDFRLMGNTIGAGFNTLVQTLERFFDRIDFKNIGRKLSDELEGFIDEVDWRKLGNLIGNYFMYTWDIFYGFVTDLNFEKVGKAISDGLEGVFQKIDLSTIAAGLYRAFNGVFETLGEISSETDWDMIANNISSGLNTFIHGVKWEEAGKNLSNFVMDLLGVFADVAEETNWQELGEGIGNFLSQIDWWGILSQVFTIIANVLGGLIMGLKETTAGKFIIAFGALKAKDLLFPLINLFKNNSTSKLFDGPVKSLCDKIKTMFSSNFKNWKVTLPTPQVSGGSASSVLKGAGISAVSWFGADFLAESLAEAITGQDFTGATELLKNTVTGVFNNGIEGGIQNFVNGLGGNIANSVLWLMESIFGKDSASAQLARRWAESSDFWTEFAVPWLNKLPETIKEIGGNGIWGKAIMPMFEGIGNAIRENADGGIFSVYILPALKTFGSKMINGIDTGFSGAFDTIKKSVGTLFSNMTSWFKIGGSEIEEESSNIFSTIVNIISGNWGVADEKTRNAWSNAQNFLLSNWGNIKSSASGVFSEMYKIISGKWNETELSTSNIWGTIKNTLSSVWSNISSSASNTISGIVDLFRNFPSAISNAVGSLYNIGKNLISTFANGFLSIDIPIPHIKFSTNTTKIFGQTISYPTFDIDWYAAGGLFRTATIAGIGEDGAEAVLPLENRRTMRMIADSIVDNSSGFGMNEEAMANAVARGVAMAMMNTQNNQPNITVYAELKTENDEVLARAVTRGQQKIDYRMNPTPQF